MVSATRGVRWLRNRGGPEGRCCRLRSPKDLMHTESVKARLCPGVSPMGHKYSSYFQMLKSHDTRVFRTADPTLTV